MTEIFGTMYYNEPFQRAMKEDLIILNGNATGIKWFANRVKQLEKKEGRKGMSHKNMIYCYVELSTEDYTNCSANMSSIQKGMDFNSEVIRPVGKKLNKGDLEDIKKEILEYQDFFKPSLVEAMKLI